MSCFASGGPCGFPEMSIAFCLPRLTEHAHLSWQWSTNCIDVSMVEILFYVADILWKYLVFSLYLAQTYKVMYIAIYMYVYLQLCIHIFLEISEIAFVKEITYSQAFKFSTTNKFDTSISQDFNNTKFLNMKSFR